MTRVTRRSLLCSATSLILVRSLPLPAQATGVHFSVAEFDHDRIMAAANNALHAPPLSLVESRHDGAQNPNQFFCDARVEAADASVVGSTDHADILLAATARLAALTAAWQFQGNASMLTAALQQLEAWCVAPSTRMLPTLEPATMREKESAPDLRQNCLRFTMPLAEFARTASFLCSAPACPEATAKAVRGWFAELLEWFTASSRAQIARDHPQADSIFWTAQASEIARFTRNDSVLRECGHRFRDKLLRQLHLDGYLAYAIRSRTPYAESMFLLECLASACESVSTPFESAWDYALPDGRSMRSALSWAAPLLRSRGKWPYLADVRNFSKQPLRENALLFAGRAYNRTDYIDLWKSLPADTPDTELKREHPITQPALWTVRAPA